MSIDDVSCNYHFLLYDHFFEACPPLPATTRHERGTHGEPMSSTQSEEIMAELCSIRGL